MEWIHQFGTPQTNDAGIDGDSITGMSLDGMGNLFVAGSTWGNLFGLNGGNQDLFLAKFNLAGSQEWGRQYSAPSQQRGGGAAADAQGNLFVGAFDVGIPNRVVSRYDPTGNVNWTRQGVGGDYGISTDGHGNVFAGAGNEDGIVTKYDAAGNQIWSRQFGSASDLEQQVQVSADALGNVFAYGAAWYPAGGTSRRPAAFVTKLDSGGNEQWTKQLRSARYVNPGGVAVDGLGNVYVCGQTNAPLGTLRDYPGYDAFLAKYDADGNRVWIREFGTADIGEDANAVSVDSIGNVFVVGTSTRSLGGEFDGTESDAFLAKFDINGNQYWTHPFGTTANDSANLISVDALGNLYVAGQTSGDLGGTNSGGGGNDFFLAKFSVGVPEPSAALLLLIATAVASAFIRR
jgi:hypothetical protein